MKPDGVTMETTEPDEAAALAEPSSLQENAMEEAPSQPDVATEAAPDQPPVAEPKVKPKPAGSKMQPPALNSRMGTVPHRTVHDVRPSAAAPGGKKTTTTSKAAPAAGAVPKRPVGGAAKNQTKVLEKRPVGPARTTSVPSATVPYGAKPKPMNGTSKRPAAEAGGGARPKPTTSANRVVTSAAAVPKPSSTATATKPGAASTKATRPATGPPGSRITSNISRPAAPRSFTTAAAKTADLKKDVSRPPSAAARKPTAPSASHNMKKHEPPKPTTTIKLSSVPKAPPPKRSMDVRVPQSKSLQPAKRTLTKKPVAAARPPANRSDLGPTPPASPATRPVTSSSPITRRGTKPALITQPSSAIKKAVPQSCEEAPPLSQRAVTTSAPQTSPDSEQSQHGASLSVTEQVSSPAKTTSPPEAVLLPSQEPEEDVPLLTDTSPSRPPALPTAASAVTQPADLHEEEDEEEREGSQLVSVSEMSGTTQPTEGSRPGSGGAVGGSAWRPGGALFSELDSEEVSVSQQGASELSAPGVLEGTESTDDLGDGSLKGASAGSPDFEKVPDIPGNDFDNEDEDDSDRVCDMDVGSERTDEPQRPRHDNDVDEEEDDDVEMASEGVTESGLESYGNADEDDFAEDERLDNLNRVAQPPPPPPLLPSAPAAQWDQPNPFADPWAEPLQTEQAAGASADPESPVQVWQDQGSALFPPKLQDVPHQSPVTSEPQNTQDHLSVDQSCRAAVETPSAPRTSLSSPLSSETSTPEHQRAHHSGEKPQSPAAQAPMPDPNYQGLDMHLEEEEEAEPETLPADEVLKNPAATPTSNPSSSSGTEDEASDMEGEAQLDSLDSPGVKNQTFECLAPPHRCLSTVEEREEAEMEELEVGVGEEATPPSATSLTSYGLDSITTASNSNAQSTGESCMKSPGIFSLEELPQEAKEQQLYIECGNQETEAAEHIREDVSTPEEALDSSSAQKPEEIPEDVHPPYYSAVCEKTEDSFAEEEVNGFL